MTASQACLAAAVSARAAGFAPNSSPGLFAEHGAAAARSDEGATLRAR